MDDRRRMTIRNQSKLAGASPEFRLIYIPAGGTEAVEVMGRSSMTIFRPSSPEQAWSASVVLRPCILSIPAALTCENPEWESKDAMREPLQNQAGSITSYRLEV